MFSWKNSASLLVVLLALTLANSAEKDINIVLADSRVLVEIYAESLCPYCQQLISGPISKALATPDIWKIANFRLIPYGHAQTTRKGNVYSFKCQHGQSECQGNIIFSCALGIYGDQAWYFILCMESSQKSWNRDGAICAKKLNLNWDIIKQCTNSAWGRQRQFLAGLESNYVDFNSVPYVLVNGNQNNVDALVDNSVRTLCLLYKGPHKIAACQQYSLIQ